MFYKKSMDILFAMMIDKPTPYIYQGLHFIDQLERLNTLLWILQ
jgi:hypothetical protein